MRWQMAGAQKSIVYFICLLLVAFLTCRTRRSKTILSKTKNQDTKNSKRIITVSIINLLISWPQIIIL